MRPCQLAVVALVVVWPTSTQAYRPFDATDADVAAAGELELELGPVGYLHTPELGFLVAPGAD